MARLQAKDLADVEVLRAVEELCFIRDSWAMAWDVAAQFPAFPAKVVAAKLSRLLRRGLLTGCDCGCRGDWELTTRGRVAAGIVVGWRRNPCESPAPVEPLLFAGRPVGFSVGPRDRGAYWVGHGG